MDLFWPSLLAACDWGFRRCQPPPRTLDTHPDYWSPLTPEAILLWHGRLGERLLRAMQPRQVRVLMRAGFVELANVWDEEQQSVYESASALLSARVF